ncbi:cellulose binding domain-containing protein [Paractinoplanes maris]|uniref:cellulose binding domain-containing protein n=1 Tax=Paractinoplanes maris TaxID=1734446 RepID=UPI0020210784|nr:cellulose binding domain-containing protein [Actinoplanes maris]
MPGLAAPGLATHGLAAPGIATPGIAAPGIAAPGIAAPGLANPAHPATTSPPGTTPATPPTTTPAPPTTSTPAPPGPTGQPPSAPTNFRVTAVTPASITLSWTAASPGSNPIDSYRINYTQAFNDIYWSQPVGNVTTVTLNSNIRPTTQYSFSVSARDTAGRLSLSPPPLVVVTPAGTTGDTTPPATPGNLRVTAVTPTGAALAWEPATDNTAVAGYNVYFFDGWYTSTLVGTTTGTEIVAPFGTSGLGLRYFYVRAKDAAGNLSIATNLVSVPNTTTPTLPPARTCEVAYRTTAEWTGGFVAEVTITNTGATAVDGWTLTFSTGGDQRVTSAWNATFAQTGSDVTLSAARWNARIAPGSSVTAGLIGRWTTSNAAPATFTVNGSPCDRS